MNRQFDQEAVMKVSEHQALQTYNNLVFYTLVKRMIDISCALLGLIILLPLFVLIVILIKLEDPKGSAFFYQTRIGKDEKPFKMYKFRSMVSNAEEKLKDLLDKNEIQGAMFKMKDDPRITKVGKFIRKTSIDELPQLVNVLKGDMSLVGPRPPLPREVAEYSEYDKLRLTVTSGCTGLWQVSGRNDLSFEEMVKLDLEYIQKRSVTGDLKIIFKTFKLLLGAKDAF
ncbi:sugar transferase [Paenibacillus sp. DLE-14]|uniref:Sugar transferase n=2 Tax=Paenibacillus lignilyticus TaxID=1172615 RepID=A0ABS5C742_9BACL|nr:sugar transferase [Paenibacillus lignilyticus]MBP3963513.1 sugar transferase [Paenibacillus lignilyticus]